MKKSLVALAVLAAAGAASAQSTVTLFGIVDIDVGSYRNGTTSITKENTSGLSSSQLGFRGVEDLGGGMSAAFWLESGLTPDAGIGQATNTNNQASGATTAGGLTFNRRSTIALQGGFGEIRLGRDYTPGFRNLTVFDPFGTVGVAQATNLDIAGTTTTSVRASNLISYLYNDAGFGNINPGFYASVAYFLGENANNAVNAGGQSSKNDGTGYGAHIGYAQGPLNIAVGLQSTNMSTATNSGNKFSQNNVGVSYDLGVALLEAQYDVNNSSAANTKNSIYQLGAQIRVGAGYIPVSYVGWKVNNVTNDKSNMFGIGYVYNLSKRTAVYTTLASLSNKNNAANGVGGGLPGVMGQTSSGIEFGLKHSF